DVGLASLEGVDRLLPVGGVAGELEVGDGAFGHATAEQREHAAELREDEHAPTLLELLLEQREEGVVLDRARHAPRRRYGAQARIAAYLAQLHQRVQDGDGRAHDALLANGL